MVNGGLVGHPTPPPTESPPCACVQISSWLKPPRSSAISNYKASPRIWKPAKSRSSGFVREFGRQMFPTFGATLPALVAAMFVRTGTTCGS
jgi:hypothetical protein